MFQLTQTQWIGFTIGAAGFLGGATGQLTVLFGTNGATYIASACALVSGLAGVFLMATTGQGSLIKTVAAMPSVDRVSINASATDGVAAAAIDPQQPKVGGTTPAVQSMLQAKVTS